MAQPELIVIHNPGAGRFEFQKDGHLAVLEYHLSDGKIVFTHTGVPEALAARGKSTIGCVPSAAGADAMRCDAGDAGTSSRSANAADAPAPPEP